MLSQCEVTSRRIKFKLVFIELKKARKFRKARDIVGKLER